MVALRCASAHIDVTPEPGMPMGGYAARRERALGAHDPLALRALYLEQGGEEALVVSIDAIRVDEDLYKQMLSSIAGATGIGEERIVVAATHTHSGPEVSLEPWSTHRLGAEEAGLVAGHRGELVRAAVNAAARVVEAAMPASLRAGESRVVGVASNRVDPGGPEDSVVRIAVLEGRSGVCGVLIHYACHPTLLGPDNLLYSGDLHGYVALELERILGAPVLPLNGAAGNISTRYTRKGRGFGELRRMGAKLLSGAVEALAHASPLPGSPLEASRIVVEAELRGPEELPRPRSRLEEHAVSRSRARLARLGRRAKAAVTLLRMGDLVLAAVPGEPYIEYQLEAARAAGRAGRRAWLVGYANGYLGYLPPPWTGGAGYEEAAALLSREGREALLSSLLRALA